MLPMTIHRFCAHCGRRIVFDWIYDYENRDYPSYYHIPCYERRKDGKAPESSNPGLPPKSGEKG